VCLILELLPGSLKGALYIEPAQLPSATAPASGAPSSGGAINHPTPINSTSVFGTSMSSDRSTATAFITAAAAYPAGDASAKLSTVFVDQPAVSVSSTGPSPLSVADVLRIAVDIAAGLRYLHDMPLLPHTPSLLTSFIPREGLQGSVGVIAEEELNVLEQTNSQSKGGAHTGIGCSASMGATSSGSSMLDQRKAHKIVHRDLKPANVLMDDYGRAKISDFGLARQHQDTSILMTDHVAAGTLPYMAPELLASGHMGITFLQPTNRMDVYSFAMILWEMLAGRPPWSHLGQASLVAAVGKSGPCHQCCSLLAHVCLMLKCETHNERVPPIPLKHIHQYLRKDAPWYFQVLSGHRPELPALAEETEGDADGGGPNPAPGTDLAKVPASLYALPQLNRIIRACWQQKEHRRPSAAQVHDMLVALMREHGNLE
jgi:serine/threonine protein kinase